MAILAALRGMRLVRETGAGRYVQPRHLGATKSHTDIAAFALHDIGLGQPDLEWRCRGSKRCASTFPFVTLIWCHLWRRRARSKRITDLKQPDRRKHSRCDDETRFPHALTLPYRNFTADEWNLPQGPSDPWIDSGNQARTPFPLGWCGASGGQYGAKPLQVDLCFEFGTDLAFTCPCDARADRAE